MRDRDVWVKLDNASYDEVEEVKKRFAQHTQEQKREDTDVLYCQIRPQGYGGGQGEPVPDSTGDSPISPDTPTRPILGTEEVIEVARGE